MDIDITLSKLIGLLLLFYPPTFLENSKNTRNELARPVMGTIFLVILTVRLIGNRTHFRTILE